MSQAIICPTITAYDSHGYRSQIEAVQSFAERIHIDLMDGQFTPTKSPPIESIWWLEGTLADIHLMYLRPMDQLELLIKLKPNLVIVHNEAEVDHQKFSQSLHNSQIKAGLAILQSTPIEEVLSVVASYDHALIFSGDLGRHGGTADLSILTKVTSLKQAYPNLEISWDGGINDQNAKQLVEGGVNVLNVGGYIQDSANPSDAYAKLKTLI